MNNMSVLLLTTYQKGYRFSGATRIYFKRCTAIENLGTKYQKKIVNITIWPFLVPTKL